MSEAYTHLHSSIRGFADEDAETRIRRIRTDRWVSYARAESALTAMGDLLNFPKRTRMPNLLLVGPTNSKPCCRCVSRPTLPAPILRTKSSRTLKASWAKSCRL